MSKSTEKNIHLLFILSLVVKAFDGLVLIAVGSTFLIFSPASLNGFFLNVAAGELAEVPRDGFIVYLQHLFQHLSANTDIFIGLYVLAHGLLNIFLVVGIYKEKLWAYWVAIVCISLFVLYQIYNLAHSFSLSFSILTLLDVLFIFLTWHEYRHHRQAILEGRNLQHLRA